MVQSPIQSKEQINKKGGIGVCVQVCVCGGVDQNLKKKGGAGGRVGNIGGSS